MNHDKPSILVVDDSPSSRDYLTRQFQRASWAVHEWDPKEQERNTFERLPCETLTAAVADWRLGPSQVNGFEVLSAIRKRNELAACVLYTNWAGVEEWKLVSEGAQSAGILALKPRDAEPELIFRRVLEEVKRLRPGFQEPRQTWEDYAAWIRPEEEKPDPFLAQAVEFVGKSNLVLIIQILFKEDRGPHRPIYYDYLKSGFSGARVFLLKDRSPNPGPRYIVKIAQGEKGYLALQKEHAGFHVAILGDEPNRQKLVGYVAEELRPPKRQEPVRANDWFGIAYREVGNGVGRVPSFRELYLESSETASERKRYRQLTLFLDRLYSSCLGLWFQSKAMAARRKLWTAGPPPSGDEAEAHYYLDPKKKIEILIALDELLPRASMLLDRLCGPRAAELYIREVGEFIELGRCSRLGERSLFYRTFEVLEAGTHGDLHAGNVLVMDRQSEKYPFIIDFSEFRENGHPFYDYARLENDIRLRLMGYEDGSDILDELLVNWLDRENRLKMVAEETQPEDDELPISPGSVGFIDKAYGLMAVIRTLAYHNLAIGLKDQSIKPSNESFSAQYTSALLHRTLISLASTDIVPQKKILALWLAHSLISRLGTIVGKMPT